MSVIDAYACFLAQILIRSMFVMMSSILCCRSFFSLQVANRCTLSRSDNVSLGVVILDEMLSCDSSSSSSSKSELTVSTFSTSSMHSFHNFSHQSHQSILLTSTSSDIAKVLSISTYSSIEQFSGI